MKILIIGGGGLIGQEIAKRHIANGDTIHIIDSHSNPYNDYSHLAGEELESISEWDYDLVSIQAAHVGVGESMYNPLKYLDNNLYAVASYIQIATEKGKHVPILFAGSMGPYGEGAYWCLNCRKPVHPTAPRSGPSFDNKCPHCHSTSLGSFRCSEDTELNPISFYGVSKKAQEDALRTYSNAYNVPVFSLRYFSVYGNQNPLNPYTGVLTIIGNQILNEESIQVNEDGKQARDLVHVSDVALAHFKASRVIKSKPFGFEAFNICTGKRTSMLEIASMMQEALGTNKPVVPKGLVRIGDVRSVSGDNRKAKDILGWEPSITIEEGVKSYCKYLSENKEKFIGSSWKEEEERVKSIMRG